MAGNPKTLFNLDDTTANGKAVDLGQSAPAPTAILSILSQRRTL